MSILPLDYRTILPVLGTAFVLPKVYTYVMSFFINPDPEKVLLSYFTITHKNNVEKIQDADVILIGKEGDDSHHTRAITQLIRSLFKPGDKVLVQVEKGPYAVCAPHGTTLAEWEDYKERALDHAENIKLEKLLALAKEVNKSHLSDAEWQEQMRTLIKLHPKYNEKNEGELAKDKFATEDKDLLLRVLIYNIDFAWDHTPHRKETVDSLKQRNISIVRCLNTCIAQKTFVIANTKHFNYRFMSGTSAAVDIVRNSLKNKKYMILTPKYNLNTHFKECLKEEWNSNWIGKAKAIYSVITVGIMALVCLPFYAFYYYLIKEKKESLKTIIKTWNLAEDNKLKADPWLLKYCH